MSLSRASFSLFGYEFTAGQLIFSAGTLVVGLTAIVLVRIFIWQRLRSRLNRLTEIEHFNAVSTGTPFASPLPVARREAKERLRTRYGLIRRIATYLFLLLMAVGALFPMLGALPQAMVSFIVAIGAAVLGIAAKPFVENMISGIVISFSSHFKIGDTIILDDKYYATVEDITISHTVLKLWDWRRHIVPNSVMLQTAYSNLDHKDSYLWAHVEFQVDYETDIELMSRLAIEAAQSSTYFSGDEKPQVWFRELQPGTVNVWLAAWAKNADHAWYLRSDMRRSLVETFARHGIRSQMQHVQLSDGDPRQLGDARGKKSPSVQSV